MQLSLTLHLYIQMENFKFFCFCENIYFILFLFIIIFKIMLAFQRDIFYFFINISIVLCVFYATNWKINKLFCHFRFKYLSFLYVVRFVDDFGKQYNRYEEKNECIQLNRPGFDKKKTKKNFLDVVVSRKLTLKYIDHLLKHNI